MKVHRAPFIDYDKNLNLIYNIRGSCQVYTVEIALRVCINSLILQLIRTGVSYLNASAGLNFF